MAVGPPVFAKGSPEWHIEARPGWSRCGRFLEALMRRRYVLPAGGELCPRCRPSGRSFVV